ncbi:hypothetical protein FHG87_003766, partial [Trinorchestia longiramus]
VLITFTLFSLSLQFIHAKSLQNEEDSPMLQMLDAMQRLLTGGGEYDREYYADLRDCMDSFDPLLTASQDHAWQSIIDYWLSNGTETDSWGGRPTQYIEQNATESDFLGMIVYEPCNYASNVAYYHDTTEICNRINAGNLFSLPDEYVISFGKTFSSLAMGSAFMHASHTVLGFQQDNWNIGVLSYVMHQGYLSGIDAPSIITDFTETPRNQTALEISDNFFNMYLSAPVTEWYEMTKAVDLPDYYLTFAGIVCSAATLAFEDDKVDEIVNDLAKAFNVPDELLEFVTEIYLPEFRRLTASVNLTVIEKIKFEENLMSAVEKLLYAFLWQEERLTDNPIFLNATVNEWGAEHIAVLNTRLNKLNTFDYYDVDFQNATDIYPGDDWCNPEIPHAKWHLEAAIGLLDLAYVA